MGFFIFVHRSRGYAAARVSRVPVRCGSILWPIAAASIAFVTQVFSSGCASVESDLQRAQLLYKDARYEETQMWLGDLQRDAASMPAPQLTRFYYLRGMTAFRLGQRDEALHFLALADALVAADSERLPQAWRDVLERTLLEVTPRIASPHARDPARPDAI